MEQLWALIHFLRDHPRAAVGLAVALLGVLYLLNRKPRLSREADERIKQLRKDRAGQYNRLRPPQG